MKKVIFASMGSMVALAAVGGLNHRVAGALAPVVDALQKSQAINATYSVQMLGGAPTKYSINLAKPNMARIESPTEIVIADGKQITTFDKKSRSYFTKDQTEALLKKAFKSDELQPWYAFFDANAFDGKTVKSEGKTASKVGELDTYSVVMDAKSGTTMKLMVLPADQLPRKAVFETKGVRETTTRILDVASLTNTKAKDDFYAFTPKEGDKEVNEADLMSGVWLTDFERAKDIAAQTGRPMLVDFFAEWCGPCKMLERDVYTTDKFKEAAKKFVLVKIDVDRQVDLAKQYSITAMPTMKFMDKNGNVIHEFLGFQDADSFVSEMETALGKSGN